MHNVAKPAQAHRMLSTLSRFRVAACSRSRADAAIHPSPHHHILPLPSFLQAKKKAAEEKKALEKAAAEVKAALEAEKAALEAEKAAAEERAAKLGKEKADLSGRVTELEAALKAKAAQIKQMEQQVGRSAGRGRRGVAPWEGRGGRVARAGWGHATSVRVGGAQEQAPYPLRCVVAILMRSATTRRCLKPMYDPHRACQPNPTADGPGARHQGPHGAHEPEEGLLRLSLRPSLRSDAITSLALKHGTVTACWGLRARGGRARQRWRAVLGGGAVGQFGTTPQPSAEAAS